MLNIERIALTKNERGPALSTALEASCWLVLDDNGGGGSTLGMIDGVNSVSCA